MELSGANKIANNEQNNVSTSRVDPSDCLSTTTTTSTSETTTSVSPTSISSSSSSSSSSIEATGSHDRPHQIGSQPAQPIIKTLAIKTLTSRDQSQPQPPIDLHEKVVNSNSGSNKMMIHNETPSSSVLEDGDTRSSSSSSYRRYKNSPFGLRNHFMVMPDADLVNPKKSHNKRPSKDYQSQTNARQLKSTSSLDTDDELADVGYGISETMSPSVVREEPGQYGENHNNQKLTTTHSASDCDLSAIAGSSLELPDEDHNNGWDPHHNHNHKHHTVYHLNGSLTPITTKQPRVPGSPLDGGAKMLPNFRDNTNHLLLTQLQKGVLPAGDAGLDASRCNSKANSQNHDCYQPLGPSQDQNHDHLNHKRSITNSYKHLHLSGDQNWDSNSLLVRFSSIMYATFLVILGCILHISELRQKSKNSSDHIYTTIVALIGIIWLLFLQADLHRYKRYASKYILIESIFNDHNHQQRQRRLMKLKQLAGHHQLDPTARSTTSSASTSSSAASLINDRLSMNTEVIFKKTAYKMYQQRAAYDRRYHHKKANNMAAAAAATTASAEHHLGNQMMSHGQQVADDGRRPLVPAYKFLHGKMGANFYLKCGMAAFCFGHVIHEGLRFGQQLYFFSTSNQHCRDSAALVAHLVTPLYSFYQLFMMFKYSNLVINRHKILARFGLMHIIGTSVTFWFRTILEEAYEDFVHKMDYFRAQNKPALLTLGQHNIDLFRSTPGGQSSPSTSSSSNNNNNNNINGGSKDTNNNKNNNMMRQDGGAAGQAPSLMDLLTSSLVASLDQSSNKNNNNNNLGRPQTQTNVDVPATMTTTTTTAGWPVQRIKVTQGDHSHLVGRQTMPSNNMTTTFGDISAANISTSGLAPSALLTALMSSPISATITPQLVRHLPDSYACAQNTLLTTKSMNALPYLYPFTIEYNLLLAATFLSLYFNIGKIGGGGSGGGGRDHDPNCRPFVVGPNGLSPNVVGASSDLSASSLSTSRMCPPFGPSTSNLSHGNSKAASLIGSTGHLLSGEASGDHSNMMIMMQHQPQQQHQLSDANGLGGEHSDMVQEYKSNFVVNADCHSANKGLFCGFFVLLVTLVTIVIFFVTINKPSHLQLGIKINLIQEATLTALLLLVTLAGFKQIVKLNRNPYLSNKVTTDDVLMLIPLPFFFLHSLLAFRAETASFYSPASPLSINSNNNNHATLLVNNTLWNQTGRPQFSATRSSGLDDNIAVLNDEGILLSLASGQQQQQQQQVDNKSTTSDGRTSSGSGNGKQTDHFKLLTIALNVAVMVEVLVQTNFIIDGLKRCSESRYLRFKKPGRELITFAILLNITYWIVATFETKSVEQYKTEIEFYGPLPYMFISHTTLPVMLFYRYHSSVCLAEIWNRAYKPPKRR